MKNITSFRNLVVLALLTVLTAAPALAQQHEGPLNFHGIRFDIPYPKFEKQFLKMGFKADKVKTDQKDGHTHCFTGNYESRPVSVSIYVNPENNHVYMLSMQFRDLHSKDASNNVSIAKIFVTAQYNDPDVLQVDDGKPGDQNIHGDRWFFDDGDIIVAPIEVIDGYVPAIIYVHQSMPQGK